MSTRSALASSAQAWIGSIWRMVESVARVSTLKLVDTLAEQSILENILDRTKPAMPPGCTGLHFLLATPFRYAPYPTGSRFRRANQIDGVFYGAEGIGTVLAEFAFYRFLFFASAPGMTLPSNPVEQTAFTVAVGTGSLVDLTVPPFDIQAAVWTSLTDYNACQDLADEARRVGVQALRYQSVRDPEKGANMALLTPLAFASPGPEGQATWRVYTRPERVQAVCEMPHQTFEFHASQFGADPRLLMTG